MTWVAAKPSDNSVTVYPNRTYRSVAAVKGGMATDSAIEKYLGGDGWSNVVVWDQGAPLPPDWPDVRTTVTPGYRLIFVQATRTGPQKAMPTDPSNLGILKRAAMAAMGLDFNVISTFYDDGLAPVPSPHPLGSPNAALPSITPTTPAPAPTAPPPQPSQGQGPPQGQDPTQAPVASLVPQPTSAGRSAKFLLPRHGRDGWDARSGHDLSRAEEVSGEGDGLGGRRQKRDASRPVGFRRVRRRAPVGKGSCEGRP